MTWNMIGPELRLLTRTVAAANGASRQVTTSSSDKVFVVPLEGVVPNVLTFPLEVLRGIRMRVRHRIRSAFGRVSEYSIGLRPKRES